MQGNGATLDIQSLSITPDHARRVLQERSGGSLRGTDELASE